jgi:hypothetical protein
MKTINIDFEDSIEDFLITDLKLQGYFRRLGNNAAAKIPVVEFLGDRSEYKRLAIFIAKISLFEIKNDIVIKLSRKKNALINAIVIPKSNRVATLANGIAVKSVAFKIEPSSSIVMGLKRDCLSWFGFLDSRDQVQMRLNYDLPDWVKSAIVIQSSANANLQLAKLLIDLSEDTTIDYSGFMLTHQDESVCSGSYEAGFWLSGSEYDLYDYNEVE